MAEGGRPDPNWKQREGSQTSQGEPGERAQAQQTDSQSYESVCRQLAEIEAIYDSAPIGLCVFDAQGRIIRVNKWLTRYSGIPADQYEGHTPQEVMPTVADQVEPLLRRVLETGEPALDAEITGIARARPGAVRTWRTQWLPLRDASGRVVAVNVVVEDVTERKQWEERLRQSEERYRTLVEIQTELVTRFLPDGTITFINEAVCRQFGRSREELLGHSFFPMIFPEDRPLVERSMASITPRTPVITIEDRVIGAGGQIRWMQWSWHGIFDAQGRVVEYQAVGRDITDRKQAEDALRQSEELRRLAEEAGAVGSFQWDLQTGSEWWSPELETIYGLEPGSFGGVHEAWLRTIHPDDRPKVDAWIAEALGRMDTQFSFDFRIIRPDGQVRWLEARCKIIYDRGGSPERVVGVNVDITSRKEAEQALQALNETLEQRIAERTAVAERRASQLQRLAVELTQAEERERRRLAQVLHDHLQQLLVAAKMKLAPAAHRIQDTRVVPWITQAVSLIDQAIAESRSLTSELSPPVLYDRGLAAGLEWLARRADEHYHLSVVVEVDPEAEPEDQATKVFVFQAARELVLNAQKHGQASSVQLRLAKVDEDHLQLVVTDNGVGFEPELLETRTGGGGFGLFSIRERLDPMGGSLDIQSRPGEGTKATLHVPLKRIGQVTDRTRVAPSPSVVAPEGPSSAEAGRIRVLLADDHPVLRKGLADVLTEQPELDLVGEASDGQEAVEAVFRLRPDVVLMDVTMPRLDGIEATRRIKQAAPEICVIGLSMHEKADMANAMRNAGASEYLTKTVAVEDLLATILKQRGCRERNFEQNPAHSS